MTDKEPLEAMMMHEQVEGIIQCNNCDFWGKMSGYIEANDNKYIKFVCKECNAIELVLNPDKL